MDKIAHFVLVIFIFLNNSCGHKKFLTSDLTKKSSKTKFDYSDSTGSYILLREVGVLRKDKKVITKIKLTAESSKSNDPLEKIINISKIEKFGDEVSVLRPIISQYTTWLDGKKYFSQIKADYKNKRIDIVTIDLEGKDRKEEKISLPSESNGIFCFFSQISECVKTSKFVEKAVEMRVGKMNFHVIWDSFPYSNDHYKYLTNNALAKAEFIYDGKSSSGMYRFILKVDGQSIFYNFDKNLDFVKKFWVSQGITQIKSSMF